MAIGSTPWQREGFGLQDLEAPFAREGSVVRALAHTDVLQRQHAIGSYGGGAISVYRYKGPNGVGRHRVSPPGQNDREIVIPGPSRAFAPGSHVMVGQDRNGAVVLSDPPSGLAGTSGFVVDAPPAGVVEDFKVTSVESDELVDGSVDNPVTLRGYGFKGTETFEAVVYNPTTLDWDPDPLVTLHSPSNVDETETTVLADLASGVPPTYPIKVRYRRS